jgi:hypothetical protein
VKNMTDAETPHELVLVARFAASPQEVWAAWTEPQTFFARLADYLTR